ncbi:MAG TPA: BBP7 family outer membrane beta-barrel protein [Fimbriiglobus sp.]|nr:BBP7 family outer membrane beta-barrel protein [Fimbriiglobus sp.]
MRGIRTAGAGLGLALATSVGLAQPPAAKLGRIQPVDAPPATGGLIARGQAGEQPKSPMGGGTLGMPRQLPGPTVTEQRGPDPAAMFGSPIPYGVPIGQPIPVGHPFVVGPPVTVTPPSVLPGGPMTCPCPNLDPALCGGAYGPLGLLTAPNKWQIHADMLLWWVQRPGVPPLVTTSVPQANGILGAPTTQTLIDGDALSNTFHTGGRFGGVYWLGCQQRWGIDGNVWFLGPQGKEVTVNGGPNGLLARPFVNLNQGVPFSEVVAAPGLATGAVAVLTDSSMWGAEANLRRFLCGSPCSRLDLLFGFRYVGLSETLQITEQFARTPGSSPAVGNPAVLAGSVTDRFRTENHFFGAQVGLAGEVRRGRWFTQGRASIAFGDVFQSVEVNGGQLLQLANGPGSFGGGLLALPGANIGRFTQERFAVVPEVGVNVGLHLTPHLRCAVGYNFLYLSSAVRPGDQIDQGLDVSRIPNFPLPGTITPLQTVRPAVPLRDTGVFAQGISFSVQYTW